MIATTNNSDQLAKYLECYGIETTDEQRMLLLGHLDLVVEKNKVINLTRIVEANDAIVRHVVDSLLLLPTIGERVSNTDACFVDIGTGAGFPGIPLGIMTGHKGTLIDSVGKKINAVREFIHELGLNDVLSAEATRAEELALRQKGAYDYVTARAVADLGVLVEYASPLLKRNGYLIVSKARIGDDELERGTKTGKIVGLSLVSRETYELPEDAGHREVITFIHDRKSSVKLPRQTGMAKHKPLV